jgi:hypothetical protein
VAWITGLDPGQALDAGRKVIVRVGPIHQPPAFSASITGRITPAPVILRQIGVFQPDEMELGSGRKRRPGAFILLFLNPESLSQRSDRQQQQRSQNENNARRSVGRELKPAGHSCP